MTERLAFRAIFVLLLALLSVPPILSFAPIPQNSKCSALFMRKIVKWFRQDKDDDDPPVPTISVGSELPEVELDMVLATTGQGELVMTPTLISEAMGRGKTILVAMPAASSKSCSSIYVPGYTEATPRLLELGVKKIAILLTSDKFVNKERTDDSYILTTTASDDDTSTSTSPEKRRWSQRTALIQTESTPVVILIDANDTLISKLGVTKEMGFGVRTNRLVVILENNIVQQVLREEGVKDCTATSATRLVEFLSPQDAPPEEDPEAIEIDFRIILAIGAVLTIVSYEGLAAFFMERGWSIPFLPGFQTGNPTPVEEVFQLLKDYL